MTFKHAVDKSQGQLIDLTMVNFDDDRLLTYVADRYETLILIHIL